MKSLCKIKGLSVDYWVLLCFLLLNPLFCFWGRLRGLEIKRSKVGTISVLCTLYVVLRADKESRTVRCRMDQESRTN